MSVSPSASPEAALLDVKAVAKILECSTRSVRRLADAGRMPAPLKIGALLRFRRADIEAWIANGCRPIRSAKKSV